MSTKKENIALEDLRPGMVLAEDIFNSNHTLVLVGQGTALNDSLVERLRDLGLSEVPIRVTEEALPPDIVDLSRYQTPQPATTTSTTSGGPTLTTTGLAAVADKRRTLWERGGLVHDGSVLIYSENPARRDTIARALAPLNLEVLVADTEAQTQENLSQRLPCALIMDLTLETSEGLEILGVLQQTQTQHVPVVIVSGNNNREMILMARRYGVKSYLKWPFSPGDLRERVQAFLGSPAL